MNRLGLAVAALLAASLAAAQGAVELDVRAWRPGLDGQIRSSSLTSPIDPDLATIDLKRDLGMSDKTHVDARLVLHTGPHSRIRFAYMSMSYDGDTTLTRTIQYGGETYTLGTRVVSDLSFDYGRLGWVWEMIGGDHVRIGTVLEAKAVRAEARLLAPDLASPVATHDKVSGVFPTVGIAFDVSPSRSVGVFGEVSGISAGKRGHFTDGEIGVRIAPWRGVAVLAGYRTLDFKVRDDPNYATFTDGGPFAGLALRF